MPFDSAPAYFKRNTKRLHRDFGAQPDNETNNDPAALMAAGWMAWGGFVEDDAGGPYCFDSPWPAIKTKNGGFFGAGAGGSLVDGFKGPWGTCLRPRFAGELITLDGAEHTHWRDFSIWPVPHVASGAQIKIFNRANRNRIERVRGLFPNIFAHVENAVWNEFVRCDVIDPFGNAAWYVRGAPSGPDRNEEVILSGCTSYTTHNLPDMVEATTLADRANNAAVTVGHYRRFSWGLAQCVVSGTTGASEPALPAFVNSEHRSYQQITDGTAKFVFLCKPDLAGVLMGNGGNYVIIKDVCKFLEGVHAVKATSEGGSVPKILHIESMQVDHNAGDSLRLDAVTEVRVDPGCKIDSARGRPYYIGAACDRFSVFPTHQNCDLPALNDAGFGPWKQCGATLPEYGYLVDGAIGATRFDGNWGANQIITRKIGGVTYQWHFGVRDNGDFEVRQDLPVGNVVQVWPKA